MNTEDNNTQLQQSSVSISVTDLRIGNLTSAGIVTEIQKDCFYVHDGESSLKNTWFDIQPIKITEGCLLKFGFEHDSYGGYILFVNDFLLLVSFEDYDCKEFSGVSYDDIVFKHVKYLHQLQNLYFSLTGTELQSISITEH